MICAPWFRSLAVFHADVLRTLGHDVRIVTSTGQQGRHVELGQADVELPPRLKSLNSWSTFLPLNRDVRRWKPDISFLDATWDPRFLNLARHADKMVTVMHDVTPHDDAHRRHGWKKRTESRTVRWADAIATFSEFTSSKISPDKVNVRIALTSENSDHLDVKPSVSRRHFAFVGRASYYKGLDFLFEGWSAASGLLETDDELIVLASGALSDIPSNVPPRTQLRVSGFTDDEAGALIGSCRAVVLPYREASQSGVQVSAFQHSTPCITTSVGALPEFQPDGHPVVEYGDVDALSTAMVRLASDNDYRSKLHTEAGIQYERRHGREAVMRSFDELLRAVTDRGAI
ncbi:glycosyltransferase family 4 protein [Rhodococcoides kroppenstedtii]|uniref:glycosyltransferase family 4 protein n=1 Tax=Rhodococcoides kroppenstedtii TaxID=293050 RepID=UPI003629232A